MRFDPGFEALEPRGKPLLLGLERHDRDASVFRKALQVFVRGRQRVMLRANRLMQAGRVVQFDDQRAALAIGFGKFAHRRVMPEVEIGVFAVQLRDELGSRGGDEFAYRLSVTELTGEAFEGGQRVTVEAPIGTPPVFVTSDFAIDLASIR